MPFDRPSLAELIDTTRADLKARLGILGAVARRAMADILAKTWGGGLHGAYGFLAWLARQLFADTADPEYVLRKASLYGITPNPATFASGTVTATGTPASAIPVDSVLVRDDGEEYFVTVGTVIGGGGTATVQVQASLAGASGNFVDDPATLDFQSALPGVNTTVTVEPLPPGIFGGADQEGIESVRARFLERLREPPTGGNDQDYIAWAKEITGVTRVWVFRHENGLGTVMVRFVRDGDTPIFPDAGEVAAVQAELDAERPTTAEVTAAAPTDLPIAFSITLTPNNATIQVAVESALDDQLFRDAEPGDGAGSGTIYLAAIQAAVGSVLGTGGLVNFTVNTPADDVVPGLGELPTRGAMAYP